VTERGWWRLRTAVNSRGAVNQVICYEIIGEHRNLIMDSTDHGFIAATGSIQGAVIDGELSHAGPLDLRAHLALMIANDDQLLGKHRPGR
jgi:hypothetical protein